MYRKLLSLVACAGAAIVFAAAGKPTTIAAAPTALSTIAADAYWRCPSGYAFEVSGTAVHCKKAAWTETKPFMACAFPTGTLKIDLVNETDMCAGAIGTTVTVEPLCYPADAVNGFTKRKVAGRDFCGKYHPADVIAPNQRVVL